MMSFKQLLTNFIVLAVAMIPVCRATSEPTTLDDLDSNEFQNKVISIFQDYANNNLRCIIEAGKYTYFSYTGRCESCIDLCSSETPTTDCEKNCQVYLNDMKTNETNAQMIERLQVAESLSSASFALNILMLVGLVLTIVYFLNKIKKVEGKFHGIPPTQESQIEEEEENNDPHYSVQDETCILQTRTFGAKNPLLQTLPIVEEQNGSNSLDGSNQGPEEGQLLQAVPFDEEQGTEVDQLLQTVPFFEEQNGSNNLDDSNEGPEEGQLLQAVPIVEEQGTEEDQLLQAVPFEEEQNGSSNNLDDSNQGPEEDLHSSESSERLNQRAGAEPFNEYNNGPVNLLDRNQHPESDRHLRGSTDQNRTDRRGGSRT